MGLALKGLTRVALIFVTDDASKKSNYHPVSVFSCFSKILEHVMYYWVFEYLIENDLLYEKQFSFQKSHSRNAIAQLVDQITNNFDQNKFTLGVFID